MSSVNQALNATNNEFNQALSKQKGSTLDKDSFLLLLVTQFKYQDPLNPMDDKEFIAQMAQFSSLEQLMNLNTSMEGLTDATNNQQMINATSYIGKRVSVTGNTVGKARRRGHFQLPLRARGQRGVGSNPGAGQRRQRRLHQKAGSHERERHLYV